MGKFDNLNDSQLAELVRRIERLERASPVNNTAIGRGGIEVYDQGTINISDGHLIVNGTATISGVLNADGTVTLSGEVTISGPLTISGATDITGDTTVTGDFTTNGPMKTTGTLSVEGVTTLKNDLNVTTGGKIKVGTAMTLAPATDGGAVEFSTGAKVSSGSGAVTMYGTGGVSTVTAAATSAGITSGSSTAVMFNDGTWRVGSSANNIDALTAGQVNVTASSSAKLASGSNSVAVTPTATTINGLLKAPGLTSTGNAANVYFDPVTKYLYYKP